MDVEISLGLLIGGALLIIFIVVGKRKLSSHKISSSILPPGSFGWPLVGEMPQLVMSAKANKAHTFFQHKIEQYGGDIFKTSLFGFPTAVFYSVQANRFLFSNENTLVHTHWPYSVTNLVSHSLPTKVGEEAKSMRKIITEFLRPQALQKLVGRVDCVVKSHMKSFWVCNEQVKAFPLIRRCLFSVACTLFFTIDDQMQQEELFPRFEDMVKGMLMQMPLNLPGTRFRKAIPARNHLRQVIQMFIDERRRNGGRKDLLSCLVGEVEEEKLTDDEIKDNMLILLAASQDTVVINVPPPISGSESRVLPPGCPRTNSDFKRDGR
ncbi:hypothetical protein SUGI_0495310 [Cryptomeria japonica]|nr:hypothetical protein SUGI_0495310 [Cryptomeria japonica]